MGGQKVWKFANAYQLLMFVLSYVKPSAPFIKFERLVKLKHMNSLSKNYLILCSVLENNIYWHYPVILINKTWLFKFILVRTYFSNTDSRKRPLHDPLIQKLMQLILAMLALLKYEKP